MDTKSSKVLNLSQARAPLLFIAQGPNRVVAQNKLRGLWTEPLDHGMLPCVPVSLSHAQTATEPSNQTISHLGPVQSRELSRAPKATGPGHAPTTGPSQGPVPSNTSKNAQPNLENMVRTLEPDPGDRVLSQSPER